RAGSGDAKAQPPGMRNKRPPTSVVLTNSTTGFIRSPFWLSCGALTGEQVAPHPIAPGPTRLRYSCHFRLLAVYTRPLSVHRFLRHAEARCGALPQQCKGFFYPNVVEQSVPSSTLQHYYACGAGVNDQVKN